MSVPRHVIIAGFGLSGRACANVLLAKGISICVIEKNAQTVTRCAAGGLQIINGDASDEEVLKEAGVERATEVAVEAPDDQARLPTVGTGRRLNPPTHIVSTFP